jgi:hypothetical protein
VFRADFKMPREVLEHCLNDWEEKRYSTDAETRRRAEENLQKYGSTPEELYQNNWRVIWIPVARFIEKGFILDGPDSDGHQNVEGDYETHCDRLKEEAVILPEVDCLRRR